MWFKRQGREHWREKCGWALARDWRWRGHDCPLSIFKCIIISAPAFLGFITWYVSVILLLNSFVRFLSWKVGYFRCFDLNPELSSCQRSRNSIRLEICSILKWPESWNMEFMCPVQLMFFQPGCVIRREEPCLRKIRMLVKYREKKNNAVASVGRIFQ